MKYIFSTFKVILIHAFHTQNWQTQREQPLTPSMPQSQIDGAPTSTAFTEALFQLKSHTTSPHHGVDKVEEDVG